MSPRKDKLPGRGSDISREGRVWPVASKRSLLVLLDPSWHMSSGETIDGPPECRQGAGKRQPVPWMCTGGLGTSGTVPSEPTSHVGALVATLTRLPKDYGQAEAAR